MTDDHYLEAKHRITSTDILIIDEISMFSAKRLTSLEIVLRTVRGSNVAFGGLQLLVAGDFFQLQPVPNVLYDDRGDCAFNSEIWMSTLRHKIELTEVIRQHEVDLIQAVNEVARGVPSKATLQLLQRLKRPLPPSPVRDVHLFAHNTQVNYYNEDCIDEVMIK
jgi:ATP-dependent DNA helicase PIF1